MHVHHFIRYLNLKYKENFFKILYRMNYMEFYYICLKFNFVGPNNTQTAWYIHYFKNDCWVNFAI